MTTISSPSCTLRRPQLCATRLIALGRPAHEHDLFCRRGVEEAARLLARVLIGVGRASGERVRAAMHVRVLVRVEIGEPVDHRLRLLRRRAIVEPDEAPAVNFLAQDREIFADRGGVVKARRPRRRRSSVGDSAGGPAAAQPANGVIALEEIIILSGGAGGSGAAAGRRSRARAAPDNPR